MAIIRIVQKGQRKQKLFLSLANIKLIATRIQGDFLTSKRASIPRKTIARVLAAMACRRLEPTEYTVNAIQFDKSLLSTGAVVPDIMNALLSAIPLNGTLTTQGELIIIRLLDNDSSENKFYINSPAFVKDLEIMRVFAQAQGLVFVQINTAIPFVLPSLSLRVDSSKVDAEDAITLPIIARTEYVRVGKLLDGVEEFPFISEADVDAEAIAEGKINGDKIQGATKRERVDGKETFFVAAHPQDTYLGEVENFAIHASGLDNNFQRGSHVYAFAFPIFFFSNDVTDADYVDIILQEKVAVIYDDSLDYNYMLDQVLTHIISLFGKAVQIEAARLAGLANSRNRGAPYQPLPAVGADIDNGRLGDRPGAPDDARYGQVPAVGVGAGGQGGAAQGNVDNNNDGTGAESPARPAWRGQGRGRGGNNRGNGRGGRGSAIPYPKIFDVSTLLRPIKKT